VAEENTPAPENTPEEQKQDWTDMKSATAVPLPPQPAAAILKFSIRKKLTPSSAIPLTRKKKAMP